MMSGSTNASLLGERRRSQLNGRYRNSGLASGGLLAVGDDSVRYL